VKADANADSIVTLAFSSDSMSMLDLTDYAERFVVDRLSTVPGVASVSVVGGRRYSMRVWIDPVRLAAQGLTAPEILTAINASNYLAAPGKVENRFVASTITLQSTLQTAEAFGQLPINSDGDEVVRLRDVAEIELGAESTDTIVSFNGSSGTFIGIFPTPAANPIDMAAAVNAELPSIQASLPPGMSLVLVYDATEQISASIEEVFKTIGEAVVIVVIVIILFLGSFRSVIIPIVTIPVSLIGAGRRR